MLTYLNGGSMCTEYAKYKCCCEQPEKLKGKPEQCTEAKIRKCHGESKHHPCMKGKEEKTK